MRLRVAIIATDLATPAQDELLSTLSATAAELDEIIKHREAAIHQAAGKVVERERQRQQRAARELQLVGALETANNAAKSALTDLLLSEDAGAPVARARIVEFEELASAKGRLTGAQTKERRAQQALFVLATAAKAIWVGLGDAEPAEPAPIQRTYRGTSGSRRSRPTGTRVDAAGCRQRTREPARS